MDGGNKNNTVLSSHCETCFPLMDEHVETTRKYVDLLEFSNFNGVPYPVIDVSKKPKRLFADFRYCWSLPLVHSYPSVEKEVLSSARVRKAVLHSADSNGKNGKLSRNHRAINFYTEISARLSKFICKCCSYVLYKVFRRTMDKLLVCPDEVKRLKVAEQTGTPLVYLPLHRSHLDYLLITWSNWHFGLKLPHIASGDNLNLSGLGWLLRATGAFFIRRRIDPDDERGKDNLYRSILHSYIEQVLAKKLPIEFFLEGTRSRFGKVLTPKNGLISNVVEAVQHGFIEDCFLVPVSYTYDSVVEGIFIDELMGIPKTRESVLGVIRGIFNGFSATKQCGVVRMHYGRPVRLTEYLATISASLVSSQPRPVRMTKLPASFSYRELVPWHRTHSETVDDRSMIRAIGFHVVYDAQMMCSISPNAVISTIVLAKWRERSVSKKTFDSDCEWLCKEIIADGGDVGGFHSGETSWTDLASKSYKKLSSCIRVNEEFVHPVESHSSFIQLAYNKNSVICRFSMKAVVAIIIVSNHAQKKPLLREDIIRDAMALCDWLQFEFLFCRPCEDLGELFHQILDREVWSHPVRGLLAVENRSETGAGDNCDMTFSVRDQKAYETLLFYANLIRPFVQSLYIVSSYVTSDRCPEEATPDSKVIRMICQESLSDTFPIPFTPYLEAVNSDSFKNSIRVLKDKGMLSRVDANKVSRVRGSRLQDLIDNLGKILSV